MEREKPNTQSKTGKERKEGFIIVPNYFLKKWVKILGVGPVVLYQELLTYCHKGKYIAWPTIDSLCQEMGIAKTTLLRYQNTLIRFGLIKNIARAKSTTGHYRNNIYQVTPLEELPDYREIRYQNDTDIGSKMLPDRFQNDTNIGSKMKPSLVAKRYPNNSNINNTNKTAANREAAAAFKKLKEKGEEKMQAVREQLRDLDFKEEFIEQLLKDYPPRKIEKKLDLLFIKRNIQNPAGWLMAALKDDYPTPHPHLDPPPSRGRKLRESVEINSGQLRIDSRFRGNDIKGSGNLNSQIPSPLEGEGQGEGDKILSTEEARRRFHLLRQRLMAIGSP